MKKLIFNWLSAGDTKYFKLYANGVVIVDNIQALTTEIPAPAFETHYQLTAVNDNEIESDKTQPLIYNPNAPGVPLNFGYVLVEE